MIANANRDPKKRRKPYQPDDFMPKFERSRSWADDGEFPSLAVE